MKRAALLAIALLALGCATAKAPAPMAAPPAEGPTVVLVPGMTGSRLCDARTGELLWGDSTRLVRPWDGGYRLAVPLDGADDGIVPCGAIREMRVASWRKDIYGGLLDFLALNGRRVHVFDHDWRRDNVENARKLVAELERIDGPVHLICQSNANYICRYAVMFGDVSAGEAERGARRTPDNVEKLILVGTANGGAMRILRELNRGRQYIRLIGRRWRPETFFTMRSLYQDLPVYGDVGVDVFDVANWKTYGWSIYGQAARRRLQRTTRFGTPEERDAFLRDALQSARRMHALLRRGSDAPLPRYYSIQSLDFPTPSRAIVERRNGRWRTRFVEGARGDLHATRESQQWLSPAETAALAMPPVYVRGPHFEMITTDETRALLLRILLY